MGPECCPAVPFKPPHSSTLARFRTTLVLFSNRQHLSFPISSSSANLSLAELVARSWERTFHFLLNVALRFVVHPARCSEVAFVKVSSSCPAKCNGRCSVSFLSPLSGASIDQVALCYLERKEIWRVYRPGLENSMALLRSYNSTQRSRKASKYSLTAHLEREKGVIYTYHCLSNFFAGFCGIVLNIN